MWIGVADSPAYMLLLALLPALARDYWQRALSKSGSPHPLDWLALAWLGVNLASSFNVWHWPAYGQG
ncbi:MAG: hypothetical protein R2911_38915 [Caldilineaceae bacterium]